MNPTDPLAFFDDLGRRVERDWRAAGYRDDALADLAAEQMQRALPSDAVDPDELIDKLLSTFTYGPQMLDRPGNFGNPPFSVYESDRLAVQVLFWLNPITSVHAHRFTGAFSVLNGRSVEAEYDWRAHDSEDGHVRFGELTRTALRSLGPGEVRRILPDDGTIHAVFHVERPTISVVVRSYDLVVARPQFNFLLGGLATDPFYDPIIRVRQVRLLQTLARIDPDAAVKRLTAYVAKAGREEAIYALLAVEELCPDPRSIESALDVATAIHGPALNQLREVFSRERSKTNLFNRCSAMKNADHRFLVAGLMLGANRSEVLNLVASRAPDAPPADTLARWLEELCDPTLERGELEGLGIDLDASARWVLNRLVRGESEDQVVAALKSDAPDNIALDSNDVAKLCFMLPQMAVLRPLFCSVGAV